MATKPTRDKFPRGLVGNRKYQLALEAYNRGIQKPKPKPTNDGRRPNTYPTAAEVRGRANGTAPAAKPAAKPSVPAFKDGDVMEKEGNKFSFQQGQWLKIPPAPKLPPPQAAPALRSVVAPRVSSPVAPAASPATAMKKVEAPKPENNKYDTKPAAGTSVDVRGSELGKAPTGEIKGSDPKIEANEYSRLKNAFYDAESPRKAAIAAKALQQYRAALERNKGQAGSSTIVN